MLDRTQSVAVRATESVSVARTVRRPRRAIHVTPYLFLAPALVLFCGLIVYPMMRAFQMSLYDWKVLAGATSTFIGLDNYSRAMADPTFWRGLANSGFYMALSVPPQIVIGLLIAMLLKAKSPAQPVYRVLFYLPVVTSWVVVSLLFKYLFADNGLINYVSGDLLHLGDGSTSWLSSRWTALIAICALGVWKGIGWSMMIFLAALQGVPKSLEEAAVMDGANRWQRFRVVTLPAIRPALAFVVVMLVIGGFNVFTSVLLMTAGGPGGQTEVLLTYMYRQAFTNLDFGYGSAIAVLLTVVVFVLSLVQMRLFKSGGEDER
ncbi:carbohydrate ABC transporter permease [Cellulomonas sp. KRMCY2]|uniref:carbohydrate ABC transporter permease n=1 Tax=Cellulomonas sp. KRMCY2 TaxID=1304865 RepID=UPI00045EA409|nr:sugar ABC transporter permease [Cellulomonas sp. KRMCY2]